MKMILFWAIVDEACNTNLFFGVRSFIWHMLRCSKVDNSIVQNANGRISAFVLLLYTHTIHRKPEIRYNNWSLFRPRNHHRHHHRTYNGRSNLVQISQIPRCQHSDISLHFRQCLTRPDNIGCQVRKWRHKLDVRHCLSVSFGLSTSHRLSPVGSKYVRCDAKCVCIQVFFHLLSGLFSSVFSYV